MAVVPGRFKPNSKGIGDVLRSPEVQADLEARGRRVVTAAGPGHAMRSRGGRTRARVEIRTTTRKAAAQERQTHNLVSALDAAR